MIPGTLIAVGAIAAIPAAKYVKAKISRQIFLASDRYKTAVKVLTESVKLLERRLSERRSISDDYVHRIQNDCSCHITLLDENNVYLREQDRGIVVRLKRAFSQCSVHNEESRFIGEFADWCDMRSLSNHYISHSELLAIRERCDKLYADLKCKETLLTHPETRRLCDNYANLDSFVLACNAEYVKSELSKRKLFFDRVAGYPLDEQQRMACVTDEDSALVVAGAGSGKTSVIMAKVAYLLKVKRVNPSEILLISFTNKASEEMTERIQNAVPQTRLKAQTFHKFGLEVIKSQKRSRTRYDIVDDALLKQTIHNVLTGDETFAPADYENVIRYFAYYFNPQGDDNYSSFGDQILAEKGCNLESLRSMVGECGKKISLRGEQMKSLEEVRIANFLYMNSIEYEYERPYDREYDGAAHRSYKPDFYLPEYGIYLEHYALGVDGKPPRNWNVADRKRYMDGVRWKRQTHASNGNKYVESFSAWESQGLLFENLEAVLRKQGVQFVPRNPSQVYKAMVECSKKVFSEYERLHEAFINLFKGNGYSSSMFDEFLTRQCKSKYDQERQTAFLKTSRVLYAAYQRAVKEADGYDFNDMLSSAIDVVAEMPKGTLPYRYIIVDEFQDSSLNRMMLLQAVIANTGAHLFCVGDDWQSIYRFAGSDVNLFTRFAEHFGYSAAMKIENTYRNSQDLIDIMGKFVMKNPSQIPKSLRSVKRCSRPIVPVVYTNMSKESAKNYGAALDYCVRSIATEAKGKTAHVLLLGRTRYDEELIQRSKGFSSRRRNNLYSYGRYENITFEFLTVHKAKGLEGDYVILLNAQNGLLGFPNHMSDDPLLNLVLSQPETFQFAEERRLFYVAMTRTRNTVFVVTPKFNASPFIEELRNQSKSTVMQCVQADGNPVQNLPRCPICRTGYLRPLKSDFGIFYKCSNAPRCDYKVDGIVDRKTKMCPVCGCFLQEKRNRSSGNRFLGCSNFPSCKYTLNLPNEGEDGGSCDNAASCSDCLTSTGLGETDETTCGGETKEQQPTIEEVRRLTTKLIERKRIYGLTAIGKVYSVRGLHAYGWRGYRDDFAAGSIVRLVHDGNCKQDANAVKVLIQPSRKVLGYLAREEAGLISKILDHSFDLWGEIVADTYAPSRYGQCRIRITKRMRVKRS